MRDDVGAVRFLEAKVILGLEFLRLLNLLLRAGAVPAADDVELGLVLLPLLVHDEVAEERLLLARAVLRLLGVEVFAVSLLSLVSHALRVRVRVCIARLLLHPQAPRGVGIGVGGLVVAVAALGGVLEGPLEIRLLLDVGLLAVVLWLGVLVFKGARAALEELVGDHLTQRLLLGLLRLALLLVAGAGFGVGVVVREELRVGLVDRRISLFYLRECPSELLLHLPRDLPLVGLARARAGVIVGASVADDELALELLLQPLLLLPALVVLEPRGELFVDCERVLGALDVRVAAVRAARRAGVARIGPFTVRTAVAVAVEHLLGLGHLETRRAWRDA